MTKEAKRAAVVKRLQDANDMLPTIARMWDERTLDFLILILGIGRVELEQ